MARATGKGALALLGGDSSESRALAARLRDLRGFSHLTVLAAPDDSAAASARVHDWLETHEGHGDPARAVFVDTASVSPREVLEISRIAGVRRADVYVLSGLLGPLEGSRVLHALFHAPVIRVRHKLESAWSNALKRAFDIIGSAALLALTAPLVAALALVIKLTSPGPVFYTQMRIGRFGRPFEFYKFRSMVVNDDASQHESYVKAFMAGEAEAVLTADGDAVFKTVTDPRITPVGRFIRKYSLDEIPQFWNTLKGDMSLVGPRPPLQYEVDAYDEWARMRLRIQPGVTGMWQVAGRSRVSFDEMILQDLMYAQNGRLCVDVGLCLLTVPAAVIGYGGG